MMLQQTQVSRVIPAFESWIGRFPTVQSVASATRADCLLQWAGLGYNRRAKYLHDSCSEIAATHNAIIPQELDQLVALPGIGKNTASAIMAYSYNEPVVFIETNIRTVFIHHFFSNVTAAVADAQLMPLIQQTVDAEHPREWYWALMDYGSHLKKTVGNVNRISSHYTKQSKFDGSSRQIRGMVIALLRKEPHTLQSLEKHINDTRLSAVLDALESEGLVKKTGVEFRLSDYRSDIL